MNEAGHEAPHRPLRQLFRHISDTYAVRLHSLLVGLRNKLYSYNLQVIIPMRVVYYQTAAGRCPVKDFMLGTSSQLRDKFDDALRRLSQGEGLPMPLSRNMASIHRGLHELRLKDASGAYRIFYYMKIGDAIYLVHAFKKKTPGTPSREIHTTLQRIKEL